MRDTEQALQTRRDRCKPLYACFNICEARCRAGAGLVLLARCHGSEPFPTQACVKRRAAAQNARRRASNAARDIPHLPMHGPAQRRAVQPQKPLSPPHGVDTPRASWPGARRSMRDGWHGSCVMKIACSCDSGGV